MTKRERLRKLRYIYGRVFIRCGSLHHDAKDNHPPQTHCPVADNIDEYLTELIEDAK